MGNTPRGLIAWPIGANMPPRANSHDTAWILLVEDEESIRSLILDMLAADGRTATAVASAEEALSHLDDPTLALVITDIVLPAMTGLDLQQTVRRRSPGLPVLLISGSVAPPREAVEAGPVAFLPKPFSRAELHQAVSALLALRSII